MKVSEDIWGMIDISENGLLKSMKMMRMMKMMEEAIRRRERLFKCGADAVEE